MSEWPRHFSEWSDIEGLEELASDKPWGLYRSGLKRTIDLGLVILSLPVVLPVVVALVAVLMFEGGHPFFAQMRVGRGGRLFKMWKLRTMVHGADRLLEDYLDANPQAREEWMVTQKLKDDPRITRFGRVLRRSSLDELPQLWNVLKGDMSLVGPRPMLPEQRRLYPGLSYYKLRPGLTGSWQVSDRNSCSFLERARHDDVYERSLSLTQDARLLATTLGVVMKCTGY